MKGLVVLVLAAAFAMGASGGGHVGHGREHRYALRQLGGDTGQMQCLDALWTQESNWDPYAVNHSSGAYGIPQSLGHGHPFALGDWRAQIRWGLGYIHSRYGSPCAAWSHEQNANWY